MAIVSCIPGICNNIEDPGKRQGSINELCNLIRLIKKEDQAQANKAGLALIEIQDEILVTIPEGDIVSNIEEKLKETMAEEEKLSGKGLEVEKHDFMKAFESSCKINKQ